jgi:GNAT superfamily N-acetyltransferase
MAIISKPKIEDLEQIKNILTQWTDKEDVDKYLDRIASEISGETEFNMQFWAAKEDGKVIGVTGLSDVPPDVLQFAKTDKPAEIKILYVDGNSQGKGVGGSLIDYIEVQAKTQGYTELMVRSANRVKFTSYGFYLKCGYQECGVINKEGSQSMQVFRKKL